MKVHSTLRSLMVALVVAAIAPLFVFSVIRSVVNTNLSLSSARQNLEFTASAIAQSQERVVDSARQLLVSVARVPGLVDGAGGQCRSYFKNLNSDLKAYGNIGIISAEGIMLCHSKATGIGDYVGDRGYFKAAMARGDFIVSNYMLGRISNKPLVVFALPVKDAQGRTAAVAFATMHFHELVKAVGDVKLPAGIELNIMDRAGVVLAQNTGKSTAIGQLVSSPLLQKAIQSGTTGILEGVDLNRVEKIYVLAQTTSASDSAFIVAVGQDRDAVVEPARFQLTMGIIVLLLVTGTGCVLAWVVGGRAIMKPALAVLNATQSIQAGHLDVRIPMMAGGAGHEFNRIADGFNRMAETLEQRQHEQISSYAALRDSQRKLLEAQRLGQMGHWSFDQASQLITWSDEFHKIFGLARGAFDGRHETMLDMIHHKDIDRYLQCRKEALQNKAELDIEFRIVTPTGQTRWLHQLGQTYVDPANQNEYRAGVVQEITTRKQTELALARSTDLLHRTGKMASVGGWEISFSPLLTHWTDEIYLIYELEPGARFSARRAIRFFAPEAQPVLMKALRGAVVHGTAWDIELALTTAKGRRIWVRTQGQAIFRDGVFFGLSGVLQDITSQRNALTQLRLLETCVSCLNDIVLITEANPFDEPGPRIVFVNDAFERRTGYSREDVLGQSPRILQGRNTQRSELDRIGVALKNWQPVRAELINYTKSGDEFWIELDIVPVADNVGWFTHWVAVSRDITPRKQAERALSDSEQRYAALFELAPVPMWVYDAETFRFLAVNSAATRDYGHSAAEFLEMSIFDIRSEIEAQNLKKYLLQGSSDSSQRWEHRRKDGSLFTVRGISAPIQYADKPARFAMALDVMAQVQAENEVRDYLTTLQRAALANQTITLHLSVNRLMDEVALQARYVIGSHQAVISLCMDDDWTNATHVFSLSEKYRGYGVDDSSESQPHKLLSMGGADTYASICEKNQVVRLTQAELELHPDWCSAAGFALQQPAMRGWLAIPLTGRNGKKIGLLQLSDKFKGDFTLQDEYVATELAQLASIAIENAQLLDEVNQLNTGLEQKVAERTAALARQEALFRALAEQAPQVIWTMDPEGCVTYLNRAWFKLMGGQLSDWDGQKWFAAIHPEDLLQVQANWTLSAYSQTPFFGMRRLLAKDGSVHVMSYRALPVFDAVGKVDFWVGIDADVTEIKAIESALRLSNEELEAFSYSVSHDLRSPLNTIDGFSRLLSKQLGTDVKDKELHYLSRIQAGVAQMGRLIEDLLSLAQVSRMQLQNEKFDLTLMAQRTVEEFQSRDVDRKVEVRIENGLSANGDGGLIRIVLENLLGNAWKFTSHLAYAAICVGQKTDAAGLPVFFVSDNGAGFDMAYADKLFVAFQRLHLASEFPGSGIGLATVNRAIARHGGLLWAEAAVGKGATFFFTLPKPATSTDF